MTGTRAETDSLGSVEISADRLWGAQTQRSLQHFNVGADLIPREMIIAYATPKMAADFDQIVDPTRMVRPYVATR
jgi:fumarate hydratase class II